MSAVVAERRVGTCRLEAPDVLAQVVRAAISEQFDANRLDLSREDRAELLGLGKP